MERVFEKRQKSIKEREKFYKNKMALLKKSVIFDNFSKSEVKKTLVFIFVKIFLLRNYTQLFFFHILHRKQTETI